MKLSSLCGSLGGLTKQLLAPHFEISAIGHKVGSMVRVRSAKKPVKVPTAPAKPPQATKLERPLQAASPLVSKPNADAIEHDAGQDRSQDHPDQASTKEPNVELVESVRRTFQAQARSQKLLASSRKMLGTMGVQNGVYGCIKQDTQNPDVFCLPAECTGFDGKLPPKGTRVQYYVGFNMMKGGLRAIDVVPDDGSLPPQSAADLGKETGMLASNKTIWGLIKQDSGLPDILCTAVQCAEFNGELPPEGTRVQY